MKKIKFVILIFGLIFPLFLLSEEARILRYPNASKTQIAFCYAGDIYTVPRSGGIARRLTTSEGLEMFPRFSPDGKYIAFSAEYDGNREVYYFSNEGGVPIRLTYSMDVPNVSERMGPDKAIMGWTADGEKILYRSRHKAFNVWTGRLYFISKNGGLPEEVPLAFTGFASLSPDGTKLAFNRIYREYRTWKYYRGGQAENLYVFDFKTKKVERITDSKSQNTIPMWYKDKIYFISDRDRTMNIFVYDTKTKETRKVTHFTDYDVKFPSLGIDNIAFENAGYVYILDLETEKYEKVSIEIKEDFPDLRVKFLNVAENITSFGISVDGKSALFCARGEVFTVPAEKGLTKNLTKTNNVHDRNAVWSPDGKWIAFVSDRTGEDEIYLIKPDGTGLTQLTNDAQSYRYELLWSPDSKKLLTSDKTMRLYYIDVETKKVVQIYKSKHWEIRDFAWSPDSRKIAFSDYGDVRGANSIIFIYNLDDNKIYQITDEFFNSGQPEFSPDGKYLFFVSDRTFNATISNIEWNFALTHSSKIYGVTLQKAMKSPFAFEESEEQPAVQESAKSKESKKEEKAKKEENITKIDFDGIKERVFELPIDAGYYWGLKAVGDKIYYVKSTPGKKPAFYQFNLKDKKETEVGEFSSYQISNDGKKIIFVVGKDYYITDLQEKIKPEKGKLDLSNLIVEVNRKEEWKQIFEESWRQMRDFFYAPNMHGVDWKAIGEKYRVFLPYVNHRSDLTYVIGEMIGELNVGHAYVGGGDMPKVKPVPIGLLGAEFELDAKSGFYKITKILQGRNWDEETRSPLTEPGIDIKEGDYLIAIDGEKLSAENHPYKLLVNKSNKYVTLRVSSTPDEKNTREYTVKTIANEQKLRYFNWVENNRKKVEEATQGRVAYVHIPDMGVDNGLKEFMKYFYPQSRKDALIVDDRFNGGGNVSPMIIERLRRVLTIATIARNQEVVGTKPDVVMTGPMVLLLNELSMSDGDLFPYQFKQLGLGKLIGKRSWGGVIGIRGSLPFLDGGYLMKPEFANFGADGTWVLEGEGQEPDIEVENDPAQEYLGVDNQLNKAIEVILEEMKYDKKPKIPKVPPYPDKSK